MQETIVAAASGAAASPIALIRISGDKSLSIIEKILKTDQPITSRKIIHGWIVAPGKRKIDEVMAWYLKGPKTYTGEDMVEISCHGSRQVVNEIIDLIISEGARGAERGEFTRRGFINGKIDLTQAEAIIDLINAKTEKSASSARNQIAGELKRAIEGHRKETLKYLSMIEAEIDFPEEVENKKRETKELAELREKILNDIKTASFGKIIRRGGRLALIGRPNVGKSSLLNRLIKEERAIVTDIPGTTRDTIEEEINIKGYPFIVVDTAGLREESGEIERMGIKRSIDEARQADIIIFITEAGDPFNKEDREILNGLRGKKLIKVINKIDLKEAHAGKDELLISVKTDRGIDLLEERIIELLEANNGLCEGAYGGINERHKEKLIIAEKGLERALAAIDDGLPAEAIAVDLKEALVALGDITGHEASEEVIGQIFDKFCIGK